MPSSEELNRLIRAELDSLREIRHDLHAHPQLAFEEEYASGVVQRELNAIGIPFEAGLAKTGVVGWITPPTDAPSADDGADAIGLRADMDALPILEETGAPYASTYTGRMHACGHDGHTTILLGAARVLWRLRERLTQPVKLIFQPAEEVGGGAAKLIEAGALSAAVGGLRVGMMFGLHGWPALPLGTVVSRPGEMLASTDLFTITITGRGGHGAMPHTVIDPVVAAAQVIIALQTITSRNTSPTDPAVLSVCTVHGGEGRNVIPGSVELGGTVRALHDATADHVLRRMAEIAEQTAAALGCEAQVRIDRGYPVTRNDPDAMAYALDAARRAVGKQRVNIMERPEMIAEDFAYYGRETPSCFALLGVRPGGRDAYPSLHTPRYDFNDDAIEPGVRLMCEVAVGEG